MKNHQTDIFFKSAAAFENKAGIPMIKIRHTVVALAFLSLVLLVIGGCATQPVRTVPPVMVSTIIRQSHEGVPDNQIIQQIAESGTVYRLSASELANLRDKGVSDAVINYMQQTYLDAIRRDQSVADLDLWTYGPDGYYYGGYPFGWNYTYVPEVEPLSSQAERSELRKNPNNSHG